MRKADGSYTYFVPDVAYHLAKFERGFNRALNIQGSDHHGTVARVRAGIQAASGDFGFNIPKTFPEYMLHKMLPGGQRRTARQDEQTRGTYVTLSDLVNWVGKMLHVSSWLIAEPTLSLFLMWIWPLASPTKTRSTICSTPMPESALFLPRRRKRH